jgi:hypothetical protein
LKDEKDGTIIDSFPGYLVRVFKNQTVFNSSPLFLLTSKRNKAGVFSLGIIDPNTNNLKVYKDMIPDLNE